jgi:hypothetical protein
MSVHNHRFVEDYKGFVAFGLDRPTDEASLVVYLQKFADDDLMAVMRSRMTDEEINQVSDLISRPLRQHLSEDEYHRLFLKNWGDAGEEGDRGGSGAE